jgi:hypothetical protein
LGSYRKGGREGVREGGREGGRRLGREAGYGGREGGREGYTAGSSLYLIIAFFLALVRGSENVSFQHASMGKF